MFDVWCLMLLLEKILGAFKIKLFWHSDGAIFEFLLFKVLLGISRKLKRDVAKKGNLQKRYFF